MNAMFIIKMPQKIIKNRKEKALSETSSRALCTEYSHPGGGGGIKGNWEKVKVFLGIYPKSICGKFQKVSNINVQEIANLAQQS